MEKMKIIVKECLEKYVGGDKYFHELDEKIKYDHEIFEEMLNNDYIFGKVLILSGVFGFNMVHYIMENNKRKPYILLAGSPRKNADVEIYAMNLYGGKRDFPQGVFLDDTYFSGKTFYYCKGFIEGTLGIKVRDALVAYDGCKHKQRNVSSLYRYYDYHHQDGTPKGLRD